MKKDYAEEIEIIEDCQEKLFEIIEMLESIADAGEKAYIVDHLKVLTSSEHEFMDSSMNLDDMIENRKNEEDDEEEEEDEEDSL